MVDQLSYTHTSSSCEINYKAWISHSGLIFFFQALISQLLNHKFVSFSAEWRVGASFLLFPTLLYWMLSLHITPPPRDKLNFVGQMKLQILIEHTFVLFWYHMFSKQHCDASYDIAMDRVH